MHANTKTVIIARGPFVACCCLAFLVTSCALEAPSSSPGKPPGVGEKSNRAAGRKPTRVPVSALLADPMSFTGEDIEVEGLVEHCEGGFVLSADVRSLVQSVPANLVYVDAVGCRSIERLVRRGDRVHCRLRGRAKDDKGGPEGRFMFACTFIARGYEIVAP